MKIFVCFIKIIVTYTVVDPRGSEDAYRHQPKKNYFV